MENQLKNAWVCEKEEVVLSTPIMEIVKRDCRSTEKDRTFQFYCTRAPEWCNIIPVTEDGKIVMVKQFRIGIDQHTSEIPGGVVDPEDQDIQAAAIREMEEETGYTLLPGGRCVSLGWTFSNPAMLNNRTHSFVVGPVRRTAAQNLDSGEMIEIEEVPIQVIPKRISSGDLNHALLLNAFLFLAMQSEKAAVGLVDQLRGFSRSRE